MRRFFVAFLGAVLVIGCAAAGVAQARGERPGRIHPGPPSAQALILYDTSGEWGWVGEIHARMLANLLGHFPVSYKACPIESYKKGAVDRYAATFYIGSTYGNPLPEAFKRDVMNTSQPVCWFKYNIWQLAWGDARFPSKFGFTFNWLDWTGYDTISYNGESFTKYQADPELGRVWVLYPGTCQEIATACRTTQSGAQECVPYIVKGANLWYVADLPFSYVSEEDRYLVFCDLLHDILGIDHAPTKRAIVRIEDVDATADPETLRAIADYLESRDVPFAVSVIPFYADPYGYYSDGVPEWDRLSWEPELVDALHYMVSKGGEIVMHGVTHQYEDLLNPYNGVTGDDFEFYRVELDEAGEVLYTGPVPDDSKHWASKRLREGLSELSACGLRPVAWETPHYAASATDYQVFARRFPLTIQRVLCFDLRIPPHGFKGTGEPTYFGGQFFPYVIQQDIYGQRVLPENLGNVEPDPWEGFAPRLPEDILRAAEKNAVLRDAWASFYFHPFYDLAYLEEIVEGIQAMGYTFVSLTSAPDQSGTRPSALRKLRGSVRGTQEVRPRGSSVTGAFMLPTR